MISCVDYQNSLKSKNECFLYMSLINISFEISTLWNIVYHKKVIIDRRFEEDVDFKYDINHVRFIYVILKLK